jgi:hypothetical protein
MAGKRQSWIRDSTPFFTAAEPSAPSTTTAAPTSPRTCSCGGAAGEEAINISGIDASTGATALTFQRTTATATGYT